MIMTVYVIGVIIGVASLPVIMFVLGAARVAARADAHRATAHRDGGER